MTFIKGQPKAREMGKKAAAMGGGECPHCGGYFGSRMSLLGHISRKHRPGGRCKYCGDHFETGEALAGHYGLEGLAHKYVGGDIEATRRKFALLGAIEGDGPSYRGNGAFEEGHRFRKQINDAKKGN